MQDIAKRTGVSKQAVSAVLSGSQSGTRVSPSLRDQILATAAEMQYRPNAIARSLRTQRTDIIGFYTSQGLVTAHDPFFSEVVAGMRLGCADQDKRFLLFGDFRERTEDEIYAELTDGQIDGLVVHLKPGEPLMTRLAESSLPVVAIADSAPPLPSVVVDDRQGSWLAAEHLARKGHRRILYFAIDPSEADDAWSDVRRYTALCDAAAKLGMVVMTARGNYDQETYRLDLRPEEIEWLTGPASQRPTAAVCRDDIFAYGLIARCAEIGVRVPEDLAVIGFDGCPTHVDHPICLTTVCAGWADVVRKAVSLVIDLQEGRDVATETVMPVELLAGDTA